MKKITISIVLIALLIAFIFYATSKSNKQPITTIKEFIGLDNKVAVRIHPMFVTTISFQKNDHLQLIKFDPKDVPENYKIILDGPYKLVLSSKVKDIIPAEFPIQVDKTIILSLVESKREFNPLVIFESK
ncbi:hypothetical protein DO021_15430 [Desulfobacter hydrogenophilus]|uniref:Uncharacterized protein n=1 Tax=Desulfobacter hydrogenophilus TaxID=2291 RepID=A0A328F9M6_9BACT|nr:hypothetical protein [Desulfobacter hydrogenophilus]NDY73073.1 hypothetical protein [Desulfobacter hydrogenophilus]QBH13577.1 hypothetical protein EYB58_11955 [Desulfobacter hydrogenophilus]RAM01079.1 hypothetical protein DO021_15430 [Desulfobacter hydrogenophilus]